MYDIHIDFIFRKETILLPSSYAHYRFGCQALAFLPETEAALIRSHRRLYDFGLHGPDPFFYYNPAFSNPIGRLGSRLHKVSGVDFFSRFVRRYRLQPSDAALAYLYGVLAHYCLDSRCHPSINHWDSTGKSSHCAIEAEFDRFLLEKDGRTPPHTQDLSAHMCITAADAALIAHFYAPVTPQQILRSSRNMVFLTKLLASPDGIRRNFVSSAARLCGPAAADMVMPRQKNPDCAQYDAPLLALYEQAFADFPEMVSQLNGLISSRIPLKELFRPSFG